MAETDRVGCALFATLLMYEDGDLSEIDKCSVEKHLQTCESCKNRREALGLNGLGALVAATREKKASDCPSFESLAAFLLGNTNREEGKRLEEHLSFCLACLRDSGLLYEEFTLPREATAGPSAETIQRMNRLLAPKP
ncbi:MAG: zf-HC2 domain-containing protein [Planctomycetota bacterium]